MMVSVENTTSYLKCFFIFCFLFWKFLSYLVCLPSSSQSIAVFQVYHVDGNRFDWTYWALWYIELRAIFETIGWHLVLKVLCFWWCLCKVIGNRYSRCNFLGTAIKTFPIIYFEHYEIHYIEKKYTIYN